MSKKISWIGIFTALSFLLSFVKFPSPFGSIALDSMPGFLLGIINPVYGGITAFLGHVFTSWNSGFYFQFYHILLAFSMFVIAFIFGKLYKKNKIIAIIIATILNGILMPFIVTPILTLKGVFGAIPVLLLASFINVLIASIVYLFIKKYKVVKNEES
ncbi:MAG: hypothetical protein ACQESN_09485 [Thermotogota bacterium]